MARFLTTSLFLSCLLYASVLSQSEICNEKADVLFVMDASGSVGRSDFQKQLQFAATLINRFQVGVTQFSVIRFDDIPTIVFDFDDYKTNSDLKNAILSIPYTGGSTRTDSALALARTVAFTSSQGARTGVPRIVIVSTDGQSNAPNATVLEAQKLKSSNVLVLSIGVGSSYYKSELDTIATFPEDVFEVIDYDELVSVVHQYSDMVCREVKLFKCTTKADVFFLLDSSSRITQENYRRELNYVLNFTSLASSDVIVGAATFGGSAVQKLFNLGQFTNQFQLSQVLSSALYLGGVTDTNNALQAVTNQNVFDPASGGRADAAKILIIVTDGESSTAAQAKQTAAQLRTTGVNIFANGVDKPIISELQDLVKQQVLDVATTLALPKVAVDRVVSFTALQECVLPDRPLKDLSDYCRENYLVNGIHPHPYDCTKFIECTFMKTDIMSCPPDQLYDAVIQTCNYPGFVDKDTCKGKGNKTEIVITPSPIPTTPKPCIKGTLDILLILDSSDGVGTPGFRDELSFAANLAENFRLGADGIQFAATSFGTQIQNLFNFNAFTEYKGLQTAILNATYLGGSTNTHLALENGLNLFNAAHGTRDGAPKVAVICTNGRSSDSQRTIAQATALKNAGIHVIAVGFSNPDIKELQAIASTPAEAFVNDFNGVLKALNTYSNRTCGQMVVCNGIQFADVIFVIDSSTSIADKDYTNQLTFVADLTSRFTLGPNDIRFGGVVFSTETKKLFDLKDFSSPNTLRSAILSAEHLKSGTDTAKALNYVREGQMFSSSAGARDNATKILVIFTDGRSNSVNETITAAQRLKATGVKFIAVGVGNLIYQEELKDLASDSQSLFLVAGYNVIDQITDSVTRRVCEIPKEPQNVPDYSYLCSANWWADGRHPNPLDCSTYVECYSFTTTVRTCSAGEAYDPVDQKCVDKSTAHACNDSNYFGPTVAPPTNNIVSTRGPTIVDISSLCKDHQLVDGIYPDPGSCNHFVECTAFITQHLECPEGLHFNTANSVCDDVHVVDCQVNYNYFVTG